MKKTMCKKFIFRMENRTDRQLRGNAKNCGLSVSSYLRQLIENDDKTMKLQRTRTEYQDYKKLIYEINRIGNNINQITKNNNSELYSYYDKERLMKLMEDVKKLLAESRPSS